MATTRSFSVPPVRSVPFAAALRAACRDAHVVGGDFALSFDGGDGIAKMLGLLYAANRRLGWW